MKLEPNFRFCIPVLMLLMLMNVLLAFLFSGFWRVCLVAEKIACILDFCDCKGV